MSQRKPGTDAMAVVYARELNRWGIETSMIVPGSLTRGTHHFAHSARPPTGRASPNTTRGRAGLAEQVQKAFAAIVPPHALCSAAADAVVGVVHMQVASGRFGCISIRLGPREVGITLLDRLRSEMLHRVGTV